MKIKNIFFALFVLSLSSWRYGFATIDVDEGTIDTAIPANMSSDTLGRVPKIHQAI